MTTTFSNPAAQRMEEEHEQLAALFQRLDGELALAALRQELASLAPLLQEHFASEEAGDGVFRWIESEAPHCAHDTQTLTREHAVFVDRLAKIRTSLDELLDGPVAALQNDVAEFVADMRVHERAENDLVTNALWNDIGGGA